MSTNEGLLKMDGFTIDEGLQKMLRAYRLDQAKSDTAVPEDHPVLQRESRINPLVKSLEGILKKHLGGAERLNPNTDNDKADAIFNELAYALAQTEGYKGKQTEFKDVDARRYLEAVTARTGNPVFGNKTALIESVLNLAFANPDNTQYDKNSPLAQLINYVAGQQEKPSEESGQLSTKELTYQRQVAGEKWNKLGEDGMAIPRRFNAITGIPLKPNASSSEAFGAMEEAGRLEAQTLISRLPKTYKGTAPAPTGAYAAH